MLRRIARISVTAVLGLWTTLGATEQTQQRSERVDVTRILVDARVVDEGGEPILGLNREDFQVRINHEPARVESIQWVGGEAPSRSSSSVAGFGLPETVPRGRLIVFLVQKSQSSDRLVGLLRTLGEADRLLARLTPEDRVAVLSFDSHLKVWLDFTRDVNRVRTVLAEEVMLTTPGVVEASSDVSLVSRLSQDVGRRTYAIEEALRLLGAALEPLPGSKSVVLVGYGFGDLTLTLGMVDSRRNERYTAAADALHAARAAVFCIDITDAEYHTFEHGLQAAAEDTGGFYVRAYPFSRRAINRVANALAGHYVLFVEAAKSEPGTGEIEVTLTHAAGRVLARRTYAN